MPNVADLRAEAERAPLRLPTEPQNSGALVVSLDFELMWGVRDTLGRDGMYDANLRATREVIPRILDIFSEFDVACTWATVGALFAESFDELAVYMPDRVPTYVNGVLSTYRDIERVSTRNPDLYFAPELVREIASRPNQELASHTFSHYYCLEPGQNGRQFEADLSAAVSIGRAKGYELTSLVFPRNQVNNDYLPAVRRLGFTAYRGTEGHLLGRPHSGSGESLVLRGSRLVDSMVSLTGAGTFLWDSTELQQGLSDVRASRFLRPRTSVDIVNQLQFKRVELGITRAAQRNELYHLWWHPHNFGSRSDENLAALRGLLRIVAEHRDRYGFQTLSMREVASIAAGSHRPNKRNGG